MPIDERVEAALAALDIAHEVVPCDEALADTAAYCAHYGWPLERSANCILVSGKDEPATYVACVVLATTRLDVNRTVRKKLGVRRASFASAEETEALTGMKVGGVTPFGLPAGVPLWIVARVLACERVVIGGGTRSAKVYLDPRELLKVPGAERVDDLAREAT
jgi:prolyl-tRNA editing enzyme YbaK/EbsC (Cys-tRNA(Pro) deacylase)